MSIKLSPIAEIKLKNAKVAFKAALDLAEMQTNLEFIDRCLNQAIKHEVIIKELESL